MISDPERQLLEALHQSDCQTKGHLVIPEGKTQFARDLLMELVTDIGKLHEYMDLLVQLYCPGQLQTGSFKNRRVCLEKAFPGRKLVRANQLQEFCDQGPSTFSEAEVASLLVNPFALSDLSGFAHEVVPLWWMDHMQKIGKKLAEELGIDLRPKKQSD